MTLCRLKVYILKNYYMELTLELIERVKECLEYIRPQLQADGGDVEYVELQDGGKVVDRSVRKLPYGDNDAQARR